MRPDARLARPPVALRLPTLSPSVAKVEALLAWEDADVADIDNILEQDPRLKAKTLRIAGSVRYGRSGQGSVAHSAASPLGVEALGNVVMTAGVVSMFDHLRGVAGFDIERFWRHAILAAHIASDLARRLRRPTSLLSPPDCYTSGLLHDIGQIILLDNYGERYVRMLSDLKDPRDLHHAEAAHFQGQTHAEVGGACAASWSLSNPIPTIVRYHHRPTASPESARDMVQLIAFADELAELVAAEDPVEGKSGSDALPIVPGGLSRVTLTEVLRTARQCWLTIEI